MARRKGELLVDEAVQAQAGEFIGLLWEGVSESLGTKISGINLELHPDSFREANVATTKIAGWKELSQRMIRDPKSLTLRSCDVARSERNIATNLVDGSGGTLSFSVKYSVIGVIADGKPERHRFPQSPEEGVPQLEVHLSELYRNSEREILAAMAGMRESQTDRGFTASAERVAGSTDGLEAEIFFSGQIAARKLSLMGKTTWYDLRNQAMRTWNLAGFEITEAMASGVCPIDVKQRIKLGRLDDQTKIHPAAYDHSFLKIAAPALFAAVEPFARRVARIAQKGK
jgi:hypothetical protein